MVSQAGAAPPAVEKVAAEEPVAEAPAAASAPAVGEVAAEKPVTEAPAVAEAPAVGEVAAEEPKASAADATAEQPKEVDAGSLTIGVNASALELAAGRIFRCGTVYCPGEAICCLSENRISAKCCGMPAPPMAWPYTTSVCRFKQSPFGPYNTEGKGGARCLGCNPNVPGSCSNPHGGSVYYR